MGLILPFILIVLWEILSRAGVLPPNWFPAPTKVLETLGDLAKQGELWGHVWITTFRVFSGFVIGGSIATVIGALTGYSPLSRKLLDPLLQALRNIPSMAWVPLFLLWLGIKETSKVTLIAVGVFFPVYLNLVSGILHVDQRLVEVGNVFRLKGFALIRRVILPATLPSYIVGVSKGIGYLMTDGQMTGRPAIIIASILLFALLGKLTDLLVEKIAGIFLAYRNVSNN